jgi:sortilin-related receptor
LQGLFSDIVETEQFEIHSDPLGSAATPSKSSFAVIIFPILAILTLVAIIVYLIQRHRRLQSSFSRFANSHYDTKTGATRIGNELYDDDNDHEMHQEQPRSFSDDEPLVIA